MLEALQQPNAGHMQDPTTKTLSSLDSEMNAVLREAGNDEEKIAKYNQILHRYLTYQDKRKNTPIKVQVTGGDEVPAVVNDDADDDAVTKDVLESVPKSMTRRAKLLMRRLGRSTDVSWNERGELVLNATPVPGSNVADLVNDVLRKRKTVRPPVGWQAFARQLKTMNVPQEVVGNPSRWSFMTSLDTGLPPGVPEDEPAAAPRRVRSAGPGVPRARRRAALGIARVHKWTPY